MKNKKFGVSQKAIIFRKDGRFLTIRRTKTAPSRPLYWDLPGGELDYGEEAKTGMIREIKEETGLTIDNIEVIDAISRFDDSKEFWMTICYAAQTDKEKIVLSFEHDDFRWVTCDEFQEMKVSPKNKKFVANLNYKKSFDSKLK